MWMMQNSWKARIKCRVSQLWHYWQLELDHTRCGVYCVHGRVLSSVPGQKHPPHSYDKWNCPLEVQNCPRLKTTALKHCRHQHAINNMKNSSEQALSARKEFGLYTCSLFTPFRRWRSLDLEKRPISHKCGIKLGTPTHAAEWSFRT